MSHQTYPHADEMKMNCQESPNSEIEQHETSERKRSQRQKRHRAAALQNLAEIARIGIRLPMNGFVSRWFGRDCRSRKIANFAVFREQFIGPTLLRLGVLVLLTSAATC
jgi:hypothetical protein